MTEYIVAIYDIEDIRNKKFLTEIKIIAESRSDVIDKAHTRAEKLYPEIKRMVHVR